MLLRKVDLYANPVGKLLSVRLANELPNWETSIYEAESFFQPHSTLVIYVIYSNYIVQREQDVTESRDQVARSSRQPSVVIGWCVLISHCRCIYSLGLCDTTLLPIHDDHLSLMEPTSTPFCVKGFMSPESQGLTNMCLYCSSLEFSQRLMNHIWKSLSSSRCKGTTAVAAVNNSRSRNVVVCLHPGHATDHGIRMAHSLIKSSSISINCLLGSSSVSSHSDRALRCMWED